MRASALVLALALLVLGAGAARAQDRDGDRVPDARDLCPDVSERSGTVLPGDGCPDTDGDHDGIADDYDACTTEPETVNGHRDLDGCPDSADTSVAPAASAPTRLGCWQGSLLVDVASSARGTARLVPRADGPTWLGTAALDCYAGVAFDGRQTLYCETADGQVEAALVMRATGDHAIGLLSVRSTHGVDRRAWDGTALPAFDRTQVSAAVSAHEAELQACYEAEQRVTPALAGALVVRLTVETSGEIDAVAVTNDGLAPTRPAVAACIVQRVEAWTIASPPRCAPVTTSFQLAFGPD